MENTITIEEQINFLKRLINDIEQLDINIMVELALQNNPDDPRTRMLKRTYKLKDNEDKYDLMIKFTKSKLKAIKELTYTIKTLKENL